MSFAHLAMLYVCDGLNENRDGWREPRLRFLKLRFYISASFHYLAEAAENAAFFAPTGATSQSPGSRTRAPWEG